MTKIFSFPLSRRVAQAALLIAGTLAPVAAMADFVSSTASTFTIFNPGTAVGIALDRDAPGHGIWGRGIDPAEHGGYPHREIEGTIVVAGDCRLSRLDNLIGQNVAAAENLRGQLYVRIFTPSHQIRTHDWVPARLNVDVNANDTIYAYSCG